MPPAPLLGEMEGALGNRGSAYPTRTHSGSPPFVCLRELRPGADAVRGQGRNSYPLPAHGKNHPGQRRPKVTAGIQAGALKRVHSVQFGGVPCLPSVPEVIFPVSPPTCVPLANTVCPGSDPELWSQLHLLGEGELGWLRADSGLVRGSSPSCQQWSKWLTGNSSPGREA